MNSHHFHRRCHVHLFLVIIKILILSDHHHVHGYITSPLSSLSSFNRRHSLMLTKMSESSTANTWSLSKKASVLIEKAKSMDKNLGKGESKGT
eukprot:15232488-Ditylum_brightwellii.AAC.1